MKFYRCLSAVWLALLVVPLSSCDKVSALVDKAKGLVGSDEESKAPAAAVADVAKVDEEEAKKIIAAEPRMVVVEFYTDT